MAHQKFRMISAIKLQILKVHTTTSHHLNSLDLAGQPLDILKIWDQLQLPLTPSVFLVSLMIEANFHGAADGEGLQNYILRVTFRMRWLWKWAQAIQILLEFPDWSPTLVGNKIEKSTSAAKPDRSNLLGYGLSAFNSEAHILVKFTYL